MQISSKNCNLISQGLTENTLNLKMSIPSDSDYFNGHFEEYKLLPAVAQVNIVMYFAHEHLGTSLHLQKILRTKFSKPIRPDTVVNVELQFIKEKGKINFSFFGENGTSYSSGSILVNGDAQ